MGLALVPATIVAVQGVPAAQSGLASGLLNTSRLAGGALGLAVLSTVATAHTDHLLAGGAAHAAALTSGFDVAFRIGAGLCVSGAILAVALLRSPVPVPETAVEAPIGDELEADLLAA